MNIDSNNLRLLWYWIAERENIRRKRAAGLSSPWTEDEILSTWRFCNVDRNDDRETRWIHRNIIEAHRTSPTLWLNLAIARFINWSPTLQTLGYFDEWDASRFESVVGSATGKVYTGAYMVPAGPTGIPKHLFLSREVFGRLWGLREERPGLDMPLSSWSAFLRRTPLMGDFLRNQILTDYRYCPYIGESAPDWETFFLPGPGTLRGLNRVYGRPIDTDWDTDPGGNFRDAFDTLRNTLRERAASVRWLQRVLRDPNNLGNCLCELDKYVRVLQGEGKPRSRFTPSKEPLP